MLRKKYIYNSIIIILYLIACVWIYQNADYDYNKSNTVGQNIISYDNHGNRVISLSASDKKNIIATLEIPKIRLKEDIYKISNQQKDVDKNVVILKNSTFPVENESFVFIAAHSGNGKYAYFNNIDKLSTGDVVKLYYKNKLFTYSVEKSFEIEKDGTLEVTKSSKHALVLTTCSKSDDNKQLVVQATLKEE